jgi:hypothetical protein
MIWYFMAKWQGQELDISKPEDVVKRTFELEPDVVRAELSELIEMFEANLLSKKSTLEQAVTQGYFEQGL